MAYECVVQKTGTGSGTPSTAHTDDLLAYDNNGIYQVFPIDEPVWQGARCVLDGAAGTDVDVAYADNGSGVLLSPLPYLHSQIAYTNLMWYSRFDVTYTANGTNQWFTSNASISKNQVGIDEKANEAATITWVAANGYFRFDALGLTVGQEIGVTWWVKKTTTATTYPGFNLLDSVTQNVTTTTSIIFNTNDGTYAGRLGSLGIYSSVDVKLIGDFWRVTLHHSNAATTTYLNICYPSAALASAPTIWDTSNSGSCIIGQAQFAKNISFADTKRTGPVFTMAATASVGSTNNTWDALNHDNAEGGYYLELNHFGGDVDIILINGVAILYTSSGNLIINDGTTTSSVAISTGEHKIGFAFGSSNMRLNLNGTWETEVAYDTSFGIGDITTNASIREMKLNPVAYAAAQTWVDGEMV